DGDHEQRGRECVARKFANGSLISITCHSERSEESTGDRQTKAWILRFVQNDISLPRRLRGRKKAPSFQRELREPNSVEPTRDRWALECKRRREHELPRVNDAVRPWHAIEVDGGGHESSIFQRVVDIELKLPANLVPENLA